MRILTFLLGVSFIALFSKDAAAYPWFIRDGYTACATCHADPSGAGLLTPYGRAQSQLQLSAFPGGSEEPSKQSEAVFGALPEPEWLLYSFAYRGAVFATKTEGRPESVRHILMQADLRAQATLAERFRVNGSVGFVAGGGQLAAVVPDNALQLVSREHWIGVDIGENRDILLRAGRMAVPYGLRGNEHPMWIRSAVRSDIAFNQQHGVSISRTATEYRTEWMAILGNYQLGPDLYRERGYSGFVEHVFAEKFVAGISTTVTRAEGDIYRSRRQPLTRQAHGVFARWAFVPSTVLLAQVDLTARHPSSRDAELGGVGLTQLDVLLTRGVHLLPALEFQKERLDRSGVNAGAWLSLAFFPYSHFEMRMDAIGRSLDTPSGRVVGTSGLLSMHLYL